MQEIIIGKSINKKIKWTKDFLWDFFRDVNFTIYKGEFTTIVGQSGAGKSTLLGMLLGYDKEWEGTILFNQADIGAMDERELDKFRSENIGWCYEGKSPIIFADTVKENIHHRLKCFKNIDIEQDSEEILKNFNLKSIENQKISSLSSMDSYRVSIAIAFCGSPSIIIMDEFLDYFPSDERKKLLETIMTLQKKSKITMVMVTIDIEIIKQSDRALYIKDQTMYKVDMNKLRTLAGTQ